MTETTRIFIQDPKQQTRWVLRGEIQFIPKSEADKILASLSEKGSPFQDYFIFGGSQEGIYLVQTPAEKFSLAGKSLSDYQFQLAYQEKTPEPEEGKFQVHELKLQKILDQSGEIEITEVVVSMEGEPLLPQEQFLKDRLTHYLQSVLADKKPGDKKFDLKTFGQIVQEVTPLLDGLTSQAELTLEKLANEKWRLKVRAKGAPLSLVLKGLDYRLENEAAQFLDTKMSEYFRNHPLVRQHNMTDVDRRAPLDHLLSEHSHSRLTWLYPKNTPPSQKIEPGSEPMTQWLQGQDPGLAPPLAPGALMPIPKSVLQELAQWFSTRLEKEPGLFDIQLKPLSEKGTWELQLAKRPFHEIWIAPRHLQKLKSVGIDLTEEAKEIDQGTEKWSRHDWKKMLARIQSKYHAAGFQLATEDPRRLLATQDGGKSYWLQCTLFMPLIDYQKVTLVSPDLPKEDLLSSEGLKAILFPNKKLLTNEEFKKGIDQLVAAIRKADYLLVSSYPEDAEAGFLPIHFKGEMAEIEIGLAKKGRLRIRNSDGIQPSSLSALREGMGWQEGEIFRPKEFEKRLRRTLGRLNLGLDGEIEYFYREGSLLDVTLPLSRPKSFYQGGLGVDVESGKLMAQAGVGLSHRVPKTSQVSAHVALGPSTQEISLNVKTHPVTKNGTRIVAGVGITHQGPLDESQARFISIGPQLTLLIPLGKGGVSSPWQLQVPARLQTIYRKSPDVEDRQVFVGSGAGISYLDSSVFVPRDLFSFYLGQDYDREIHGQAADTTSRLKVSYRHPLTLWGLQLDWQAYGYHRQNLVGEHLSPSRLYGNAELPIDYSQGSSRPPQDSNLTLGAHVKKPLGLLTPFAGLSWSRTGELDPLGEPKGTYQRMGAGIGLQADVLDGLTFYLGWDFMKDGDFFRPSLTPNVGLSIQFRL